MKGQAGTFGDEDLARGMGGELVETSVEGSGSTFTLTLRRVSR